MIINGYHWLAPLGWAAVLLGVVVFASLAALTRRAK